MKKIISTTLVIIIIIASIPFQSVYAFTPDEYLGNLSWDKMTNTEKWALCFNFTVSQCKAVLTANAKAYIENMDALRNFKENKTPDDIATVNDKNITISKEYVVLVKQCIDNYVKENEPYYMANTLSLDDLQGNLYAGSKLMYDTAKNLIADSSSGVIAFGADYSNPTRMFFVDIGNDFKNISPVKYRSNSWVNIYNNETWNQVSYKAYFVELDSTDDAIQSASEFIEKAMYTYDYGLNINYPIGNAFTVYPMGTDTFSYSCVSATGMTKLVSNSRRRIRIFNTYGDFQNYTLGKRNVYFLPGYYDFEPSEITASLEDIQKEIDDMQKIIEELMERITDRMDESEIEELLRQILEALKNQQGSGSGSGGGDVTVNVDLTQTNSWLAKIYAKIAQIYEKMNAAVENAEDAALAKIQESLDEIIVQLKKIKRWAAVDTVIDGVDAVADWLDLIRGVISDAKEGAGSAVAALSSAVGDSVDLMAKKFPFSIPWDILFFVSVLSAEPQVPHFEIPFNIEISALDIVIDYDMELDFEEFQWLSDLSRLLLSMTYAVGLLRLTFGVTSSGKE